MHLLESFVWLHCAHTFHTVRQQSKYLILCLLLLLFLLLLLLLFLVICCCFLFSVFVDVVVAAVVVERWHSVHTGVRTKLKTKCSPCTAPGMPQNMYRIKLWIPFQPCGIQDATAISAKELNVWREQFGNR